MDNRSFLRLGAGAAVAGAVLALVGNLAHPRYTNMDDVERFRKIAHSGVLATADLITLAALACVTVGLVAVAESLGASGGLGVGRVARIAALVGGAIGLLQIGVETSALIQAAKLFASAPQSNQVPAFWATSAVDHANSAMFDTWTIVLLGAAPVLLGLAMWAAKTYPTWLAAIGVIGGLACLGVGVASLLLTDTDPTTIPFLIGSLLVTVFVFAAGALLWKRAPAAPAPAPA
ncbi:MAG TPA: hypothetical protein VFW71_12065 [Actinomycetota bacterium]|nr:hypothetical protein [Actinomycetota bacterium]